MFRLWHTLDLTLHFIEPLNHRCPGPAAVNHVPILCLQTVVPTPNFSAKLCVTGRSTLPRHIILDTDKLEDVGPVDNRPSTKLLHHFVKINKNKYM